MDADRAPTEMPPLALYRTRRLLPALGVALLLLLAAVGARHGDATTATIAGSAAPR